VLSRVLNNMLDNAIKFTEEGSIDLAVRREASIIVIEITDTGIGIDERFLAQAFDPFTQESSGLDRSHQGSGLGLTVSKRLLELMNGKIQVDSKKDAGSVFTISLPSTR
jgi:signal transduction histidine kinase